MLQFRHHGNVEPVEQARQRGPRGAGWWNWKANQRTLGWYSAEKVNLVNARSTSPFSRRRRVLWPPATWFQSHLWPPFTPTMIQGGFRGSFGMWKEKQLQRCRTKATSFLSAAPRLSTLDLGTPTAGFNSHGPPSWRPSLRHSGG